MLPIQAVLAGLAYAGPVAEPAVTTPALSMEPPFPSTGFGGTPGPSKTISFAPIQPGLYPHNSVPVFPTTTPTPSLLPKEKRANTNMLVWMFNSLGADLSISFASNQGAPTPVMGGNPGFLTQGGNSLVAFPTNWAGRINLQYAGSTNARVPVDSRGSKIEGSFVGNPAIVDVDVSYVDGYSVPIQCYCGNKLVTGCTHSLWGEKTCPKNDVASNAFVCYNEAMTKPCGPPPDFFAACQGHAYTYPDDDQANSFGECQGGVVCCIDQLVSTTNSCPMDPNSGHLKFGPSPNPQCGGSGVSNKRSLIDTTEQEEPVDPSEGHWYYNSTLFEEYQAARKARGFEPEEIPDRIFKKN